MFIIVLCDVRHEELDIGLFTAFKEINILFFFIWALSMGMIAFIYLIYWNLSGGTDIIFYLRD
jgi:hypothetical protein